MSTGDERDINRAIEIGEKNRRTIELIRKWCKHAKVEKIGGTGLIEMQTGLPIGHHCMACDYAPMGGSFASWDIEDSAISFYDKHCATCKQRYPVGMPNLSTVIDARDRAVKQKEKDDAARQLELKAAAEERRQKRVKLKVNLAALPATIIDQLDELDANPRAGANQPLLETAKMAPEVFTPEIIDLFFTYLEGNEIWFCETGLEILPLLNADKTRLGRQALLLARNEHFVDSASKAILACISEIDTTLIDGAFDSLVELAKPTRTPFSHLDEEGDSEALLSLYESYASEVEAIIRSRIRGRSPEEIIYASTAIKIIAVNHPEVPILFARDILTKLTRAESLVDFDTMHTTHDDQIFYTSLRDVLELAFVENAKETDALAVSFLAMANPEARKRVIGAYIRLLPSGLTEESKKSVEFYTVVIGRLLELAATNIDDETMTELGSVFRNDLATELKSIVIDQKNYILGIAILLDEKRDKLSLEMEKVSNTMEAWKIGNRRDSVASLQRGLVGWVAQAASEDAGTATAYTEALNGIPDDKFYLRGIFVERLSRMGGTPEGLATSVPHLYTAILGSNQLVRARALRALEKLGSRARNDLPNLMLEALLLALNDPYTIVHKQAVSTLEKYKMPGRLRENARLRLTILVNAYANKKNDRAFFIKCATLLLNDFTVGDDGRGRLGSYIVKKLKTFDEQFLLDEVDHLYWPLKGITVLSELIIPLLGEAHAEHQVDKVSNIIGRFSREEILAGKNSLRMAAHENSDSHHIFGAVIELLTFSGDYEGACQAAQNKLNIIPDTIRTAQQRKYIQTLLLATEIEVKASKGELADALPRIMQEWKSIHTHHDQGR